MELQRRNERAESIAVVDNSSLSHEVAISQQDVILSSALQDEAARNRDTSSTGTNKAASWKELYEEDPGTARSPEEAKLVFESKELLKAWSSEVQDDKNSKLAKIFSTGPETSVAELKIFILELKDKQKPQGRARRYLSNICNTLDSHSALINMLPNQSIYASVFCGAFKTLIGASVNHRSIIETLSRGLMDAGEIIHSCVQRAILVDVAEMRSLIQRLYTTVFALLRKALDWYEDKNLKRLLNTFNNNYLNPFTSTLEDMRKVADLINAKAINAHHAETRDTRLLIEQVKSLQQQQMDDSMELWKRAYQKVEEQNEILREIPNRQMLGAFVSNFLLENITEVAPAVLVCNSTGPGTPLEHVPWSQPYVQQQVGNPIWIKSNMFNNGGNLGKSNTVLRTDLQNYSKHLEDYIETTIDPIDAVLGVPLFAEHNIVHAVQELCRATTSQVLWVVGKIDRQYPSSTSGIAASIINALDQGSVPKLYLFLDWPKTDEGAAINLLYSLIRQMINLLPEQITASSDCSNQTFSRLGGSLGSWEIGMTVLETLFEHMPPLLFLVADGFEHLDFLNPGEHQVESLVNLLYKKVLNSKGTNGDQVEPYKTFKILFTTAGNCASLNGLDEDALTIVKVNESQNIQPGQWRAGRSLLVEGSWD